MTHTILKDVIVAPLEFDSFKVEEFYDSTFVRDDDMLNSINELMDTEHQRLFVDQQSVEDGHFNLNSDGFHSMGIECYIVTKTGKLLYFENNEDGQIYQVKDKDDN